MGASTAAQVRALLLKSAVYQRRNTATNICLVVAPIFFCVLLAVLQVLTNKLLLAQREYQCGCQCTSCCVPFRVQQNWTEAEQARIANGKEVTPRYVVRERCSYMETGYCERVRNATCRSYNDSNCSLRFSSPRQAIFCPIPQPSSWPPVLQTPRLTLRAGGSTTQWLPFTGSNMTAARAMAANLVPEPELPNLQPIIELLLANPLALLTMRPSDLLAMVLPMLAPGGLVQTSGESVDAAQLSRLALTFGTALRANNDYYLENAFINTNSDTSRLQLIVPPGACSAAGLGNVTNYVSLPVEEVLLRYYNASFPLIVPLLLQIFDVTPSKLGGGLQQSQFGGITAACVDTLPRELGNATALDRRLYCGFGVARCDGTYFIREYGAAWNFKDLGPTTLKYDAYYNLSLPADDSPTNYRIPEILNMATKAWTRTYWASLPITYTVRNRLLGLMSFPKLALDLKLDFSVVLGPLFYTWVVQMLMPSFLQQLVYEKEKRLRMMMKMHGLNDVSYWLVTYVWFLMLYIIYMVFFVFFGTVIRLKIFTTSSYTLQAVLFFIFGNNMIAFVFMISSFFSSSRTATVVSFLYIFATGLIGELLLRTLMQQNRPYILAVQLLPGFALYRGLFELSEYSLRAIFANVPGLRWPNLLDPGNGMISVWVILVVEWPLFMVLGWYFEQVLNSGTGASRHPLFFLQHLWRKDDADVKALQAARPVQGLGIPAIGLPAASRTAAVLEPPAVAEAMPARRGDVGSPDGGANGGGAVSAQRVAMAGPVGEGVDRDGGRRDSSSSSSSSSSSGSEIAGNDGAVNSGSEGRVGGRNGAGPREVDGGRDAMAAATNASDTEVDVLPLPGRLNDAGNDSRSRCSNKNSGRGSGPRSCSWGSSRGGEAGSTEGGGRAASGGSGGPVDDLVISAAGEPSPLQSPRRLLSTGSRQAVSRAASGASRELAAFAAAAAAAPDAPRGGSSRSSVYSPVSVAWPASMVPGSAPTGAALSSGTAALGPRGGSGSESTGGPAPGDARIVIATAVESASPSCGGARPSGNEAQVPDGTMDGSLGDASAGCSGHGEAGRLGPAAAAAPRDTSSSSGSGSGGEAVGLEIQASDVAAEAARVAAMDEQQLGSTPIVIRNLAKVFFTDRGGSRGLSCLDCCSTQRARVAVRTLTLAIERGECFGLLGPNGAGKTTTINMLTGFLEPSAGDALVEGRSVRTRMPEIYRMMGVCPQDNLLWDQLTGEEHLFFYGRLKGLKGKELHAAVEASIKSVKLHINNAGKRRVRAYSGGMKRRLSVAISFIGNPQVVYLDEPSTGLDPASRRALWDVVREHKDGRAIILTTHSMEEAEILCDRLGIFVDGQLVCIGNPREITSRYAGYLVFTITVGPGHGDAAKAFVQHMSPNSRLTYELGATFKYELPTGEVSLAGIFGAMAAAKQEMQVLDWGVANATLEEVFIKFARHIGVETQDQ